MPDIVFNQIAFNGTVLTEQPTSHGWKERDVVGVDGNGVSVYVGPREYELTWDFLDQDQFNQIYTYFLAQGVTGSIVSTLPRWNDSTYVMYAYSGTILREPQFEGFFQNYYTNTKMLIVRITGT
jgi:hypothetical protein